MKTSNGSYLTDSIDRIIVSNYSGQAVQPVVITCTKAVMYIGKRRRRKRVKI